MELFAGRSVAGTVLSILRILDDYLEGFRASGLKSTIYQLPSDTELDEIIIQLSNEVGIHITVVTTLSNVIMQTLYDVVHLEPSAPLEEVFHLIVYVREVTPVVPIWLSLQRLTNHSTQGGGRQSTVVTQLHEEAAQLGRCILSDCDLCLLCIREPVPPRECLPHNASPCIEA
ncbi:hypothetical protein D3C77_426690 [compost metagenome]